MPSKLGAMLSSSPEAAWIPSLASSFTNRVSLGKYLISHYLIS